MRTAKQNLLQTFMANQPKEGLGKTFESIDALINTLDAVLSDGDYGAAKVLIKNFPIRETFIREINPEFIADFLIKSELVTGSKAEMKYQIIEEALVWREEALRKIREEIPGVIQQFVIDGIARQKLAGYQTRSFILEGNTLYFRPGIQVLSIWSNSTGENVWRGHYREINNQSLGFISAITSVEKIRQQAGYVEENI